MIKNQLRSTISFDSPLPDFLCHDPDKIAVCELRDIISAKIAIQAASTGHLVLGTLHTSDERNHSTTSFEAHFPDLQRRKAHGG
jgi:type IV pilus assembly protein PilB